MAILADLQAVAVRRSDRTLFEELSVTVAHGDRVGVVGINGAGKSTLLRVLAGVDRPDTGTVRYGSGVTIGYLEQNPELPDGTVGSAVGDGWEAAATLDRLGMGQLTGSQCRTLSGGQRKRVALARVLTHPADLLVLDEPTNHLDLATVVWLAERLAKWRGGLVLVSHDRHLLDALCTRMVELDRGRDFSHEGSYSAYLESRALREVKASSAEATRRNLARRELEWLRRGAPARSRKPQARVDAAKALINSRPQAAARPTKLGLAMGTPRLGDKVISCEDVSYRYSGSQPMVLDGISLSIGPGERLGVLGANGTGKTTLLDLIAGVRKPVSGRIDTGSTVTVGYYSQSGVELDADARVRDLVAGDFKAPGSPEDNLLMESFWFSGELPFARVSTLSGGERRRLQLLVVLASQPNVLLLDEPTNDLDLDTLRVLEDFLDDWPGALVAVSHDRAFLERSVDRIVALDARGSLREVPGGLAAWIAEAATPTRPGARGVLAGVAETPANSPAGRSAPRSARSEPARPQRPTGRALREVEKKLAGATRIRDVLAEKLASTSDHREAAEIAARLADASAQVDSLEETWLEIAEVNG
ncbi:MAG: ABC-F family ATP-binding cassette domain-containing protein [Acidimicrobiales bacterium]